MSVADAEAPAAANNQSRPFVALSHGPFRRHPEDDSATIHTGRPTKALVTPLGRSKLGAPENVLKAFNTWAFKREQPDSPQSILEAVTDCVHAGRPVPFVLYWGKGPRVWLDAHDTTCLDYLGALVRRIGAVYSPGASIKLIFTDTHATLNGHPAHEIEEYFGDVEVAARQRGFDACWLGEVVFNAEAVGAIDRIDEEAPGETIRKLGLAATKWFRGEGTPEAGAERYFRMNMIEKRAVQHAFPNAIFITFNGSEYRCLFPERMPIFYMYSLRRGMSVKPWFLPAPRIAAAQ
jgi:L-tyrosine isonitrile synthase